MSALLIALVVIFWALTVDAATYEVFQGGLIQSAVNLAMQPGDIVAIHAGTYTESVSSWPASGSQGNPIRIQPFGYTNDGCQTAGCGSGDIVNWSGGGSRSISMNETSYIRIQGLRFVNSTNRYAIWLQNLNSKTDAPMLGIEIFNNTFDSNGNDGTLESDIASTIVAGALGYDEGAVSPALTHHWNGNTFTNN